MSLPIHTLLTRPLVAFAHIDEPIPREFDDYAKPAHCPLSERQLQKWKSRKMAFFLLHQLFDQYQLDKSLLEEIKRKPNDRPYLLHSHIDFNISHSGEYVAVILAHSENHPTVGIDIEHPQKTRPFARLLAHYANPEEIAELNAEQPDDFYLSWCLREAVLKTQGVGIIKLSEVRHFPQQKQIISAHCPKGILHFYQNLPFYLGYFFENNKHPHSPLLFQYQSPRLHPIQLQPSRVYTVN